MRDFSHWYWRFTRKQGKGVDHLHSFVQLPLSHEHSDIYLQLFGWGDCYVFLMAWLVSNYPTAIRWDLPPCGITIWLIDNGMLIRYLFTWWFNSRFCYNNLTAESGGFELAPTLSFFIEGFIYQLKDENIFIKIRHARNWEGSYNPIRQLWRRFFSIILYKAEKRLENLWEQTFDFITNSWTFHAYSLISEV